MALETGLRSSKAFTVRRCQILLASARGLNATQIAEQVGCSTQAVRNVLHAFASRGLDTIHELSRRNKTIVKHLDDEKVEALRAILHQKPRDFGKDRSLWTLELAADVIFEQGLTSERVSRETVREAIKRLDIGWKRAKRWISSPDPAYLRKKSGATS
jgi:transposase